MITGTHLLFYSDDPDADRTFFRDVLQFHTVDAGGGGLIFGMPPAEAGIHPPEKTENGENHQQVHGGRPLLGAVVYLMCDDVHAEIKRLAAKNVQCSPVETANGGSKTSLRLPSGGELGLSALASHRDRHEISTGKTERHAKLRATVRSR
jgi:hypothetical protein